MGLLNRIAALQRQQPTEARFSVDQWIRDYLTPASFQFGGTTYPLGMNTTWGDRRTQEVANTLPGYAAALRQSPPAFAAQMVRSLVLSQARFTFRNLPSTPTPRRTFGNRDLQILERPWPNATTGELVARMEWHAGLAGNAFVIRQRDRLRVLRPDWVVIIYGSDQDPDEAVHALDGQVIGYAYCNGGIGVGRPQMILPDEMAHWSPLPDPESAGLGMSWITPAVREIQGDIAATVHKLKFFENGATPNMVVKGITAANSTQFNDIVEMLERNHTGLGNAYRTLYLTAGADATVVGSDLSQMDFKATQGAGETRIAVLSRVPASLLGISEGLAGSSLNAGNFSAARRSFGDTWVMPTLQDLASCLSVIVKVPNDAELWFDTADMTLLREDAKDAAEIASIQMSTIVAGVNGGFEPESVKAAVIGQNMALLKHTGMVSVQLQQPGAEGTGAGTAAAGPPPPPLDGPATDEDTDALIDAMAEIGPATRAWTGSQAALHPRGPGGKFKSTKDRLVESINATKAGGGGSDPFEMFSREQLNRVAKARGVDVKKGAGKKDISAALLESLHGGANPSGLKGADGSQLHGVKRPAKAAKQEPPAAPAPGEGLADLVNSPVTGRVSLSPGSVGVVERVSHAGGDEFHKVNQDFDGRTAEESTDAEELAALIGGAMNLPVPRVHRAGPAEIHTDWTEGVTGAEYAAEHGDAALQELVLTDTGRLMGIFDLIVGNPDRHDGNYMVTNDGQVVGIDHGFAWNEPTPEDLPDAEEFVREVSDSGGSRFNDHIGPGGRNILTGEESGPLEFSFISRGDVAEIRNRLEALRPEFERLGRGAWLDHSMRVVDALQPLATGTGSIFQ